MNFTLSMQTLRKQDWAEFSLRHNVYNANFSVKIRSEHVVAIEYTYFSNDYNCLHTIVTIAAYKAF